MVWKILRKIQGVDELVTLVDAKWKWKWKEGRRLCYSQAWYSSMSSRLVDVEVARDCIQRACGSS